MNKKKLLLILTTFLMINSSQITLAKNLDYSDAKMEIKKSLNNTNGWVNKDSKWYYLDSNGNIHKGWLYLNDLWYYLDNINGEMKKGIQEINGHKYYLDPSSGVMKTGWIKINDDYYFFGSDGAMRTGWINDGWTDYYLKPDGTIFKGWLDDGLNKYYMDENGQMRKGWVKYNGDYYFFGPDGAMRTGWINDGWTDYYLKPDGTPHIGWLTYDNNKYYLNTNGSIAKHWLSLNNNWYYFENNGVMVQNSEKTVNGNIYKFDSDGVMITDKWFGSTYVNKDGIVLHGTPSRSHSYTQYKLFNYMSNEDNRESVHYAAIDLHGGETTNNCVYFTSEALRRAGVKIPLYVANTYQLERELLSRGWIKSTNTSDLRPGDVVFSGYKHSFTFMNWYDKDYAYIVDNQKKYFDSVLHKRLVSVDDPINDTIRATHFFYLPE
ncbi:N-acetylmuramoyl-L-alanine amidase family protein [Clostridium perfringens]|uniref:Surface protein pspA n=1 Tax=Clostridium perfringens (strain SM101 / Type A) TaxID=289380 RepID=Q0SVC6_CLOPS|nr:N-acetylmuramoyl-L-alanine amidase family protein [Clostridium perfringens]ABG86758.1 surface protein pspA precursor [Clostridium perfringens SM101]SQB40922.1 surface protein pspA precursor [Clostridium perfringens]